MGRIYFSPQRVDESIPNDKLIKFWFYLVLRYSLRIYHEIQPRRASALLYRPVANNSIILERWAIAQNQIVHNTVGKKIRKSTKFLRKCSKKCSKTFNDNKGNLHN